MTSVELVQIDDDGLLVSLAREIAGDLRPLDQILASYCVTDEQFEVISRLPRFTRLLDAHKIEWDKATNTYERTKLKSAILLEQWLPEAMSLLHGKDTLNSKVGLAQLLAKLAGMGMEAAGHNASAAERLSITINLGSDKLKFDLPPKVIDAEPS